MTIRTAGRVEDDDAGKDFATPFAAYKSANQHVQYAIDPSYGLTQKRYRWFSNGSVFDSTLISEVESGLRLATRAQSGDEVRIHSAYVGQYISQSLAQPGIGFVVDETNVTTNVDGRSRLSHGEVYVGAFWWDVGNSQVDTGLGWKLDADGWTFFVKSLGDHLGDSPVPQKDWIRPYDGDGPTARLIRPDDGLLANFPYTWYNQGQLGAEVLDPIENVMKETERIRITKRPSIDTGNLPTQVVVRNAGSAQALGLELGGMQFTTYGADLLAGERRRTPVGRHTGSAGYITTNVSLTNNEPDPVSEPGHAILAYQRQAGGRVPVIGGDMSVDASNPAYIYQWDEYEPGPALDGTFRDPNAGEPSKESKLKVNTDCTSYTPTTYTFRGWTKVAGGKTKDVGVTGTTISDRVPIGATRVITAVLESGGNNADLQPLTNGVSEGF